MALAQNPIQWDNESGPQPAFSILKPRANDYTALHPTPADSFSLIQVAETSIDSNRKTKAKLDARAGIAELWGVNLRDGKIEILRAPSAEEFQTQQILTGNPSRPLAFPAVVIRMDEILQVRERY